MNADYVRLSAGTLHCLYRSKRSPDERSAVRDFLAIAHTHVASRAVRYRPGLDAARPLEGVQARDGCGTEARDARRRNEKAPASAGALSSLSCAAYCCWGPCA